MTKLYELTDAFKALEQMAEEGAPEEAIADTLEGIQGEIRIKGENIAKICANWDSDISAIDEQIKKLTAKKKAITNRKESLKDYLRTNMEATGTTKIECPLFTISCVHGRQQARVNDSSLLPDEFIDVQTLLKPKTALITEALKTGQEVPGAELYTTKSSIRIS